jgi:hypothetical protein
MLRVIKPTSPLSIGSYILAPFSAAAGATAAVELLGWFPRLKRFGGVVAALFGGPLATYTGVLFSNTAVPSWHAAHKELPFVFGASGMAAGGGITMALSPIEEAGPSRKMAVAGAAIELAAMHRVETEFGIVSEPYHEGKAGRLLRAAKSCTAAGAALTVVAGRRRAGAVAAGALLAAGSLLTRFGVSRRAWPAPGTPSTPSSRSASGSPRARPGRSRRTGTLRRSPVERSRRRCVCRRCRR